MKISVLDRILLAFLCIFGVAVSVFSALIVLRAIPLPNLDAFFQAVYTDMLYTALVVAVALIVTVVCFKLLFAGSGPKTPQSALVKSTENGNIRIALSALDSLVQKQVKSDPGVREARSTIVLAEGGIRVRLRVSLMPEANIPETSTKLQEALKDYVETLSGIHVLEVSVYVEETQQSAPKPRVE
jgi:hypothetical protein